LVDPGALARLKDPKTLLQEYLQSIQMALPQYSILSIEGEAHAQIFHVQCQVPGFDIVTQSADTTRRGAEQKAAQAFLLALEKQRKLNSTKEDL